MGQVTLHTRIQIDTYQALKKITDDPAKPVPIARIVDEALREKFALMETGSDAVQEMREILSQCYFFIKGGPYEELENLLKKYEHYAIPR